MQRIIYRLRHIQNLILATVFFSPMVFISPTDSLPQITESHPSNVGIKGSFVIAAICKDGIIIASDSRANIFDKRNQQSIPIAYYDTIQKIFPIGINAIAETGQGAILDCFFSTIINDFVSAEINNNIKDLLPTFINYCERQLSPKAFNEILKQKLFAVGYSNNSPIICYFNEEQPGGRFGCIQGAGIISSAPTPLSQLKDSLSEMPCNQAASLLKKSIQEYAGEADRWKTIGGPIAVLLVTQTGTRWIEGEPPLQRWKYVHEFITDYQQGRFQLSLIPPTTKQQLDELMFSVPENK